MNLQCRCCLWLLLAIVGSVPQARAAEDAVGASLLSARVTKAIASRVAAGEYPAIVVGVVSGANQAVYGFGKVADGRAPTADTVFEIGSVTKTFTATLLADAVVSGRLKFDDPVAELLPGFHIPARDDRQITLVTLAEQCSGLPRLPSNLQPTDLDNPYAGYGGSELAAFLATYELPREPGAGYEYSNLGAGLLGFALANHVHVGYGALLERSILAPLGMSESGVAMTDTMRAHLAVGHDKAGMTTGNWDFDALAGAGAIKSTAGDMLRYLRANMGLTASALNGAMALAHEPRMSVSGVDSIGLFWMTRTGTSTDVTWHNGMTGGYASFVGFTRDGREGVVVLTNIQRSVDDLGFATLLADAPLAPARHEVELTAAELSEYRGSYRLAPHFILTVFQNGDQLNAQATDQGPFPIYANEKDEFFARIADIRISFQRDGSGAVDGLVLHQNGDHAAPRISDAQAAEQVGGETKVNLPPATLEDYVGRYNLGPRAVFTITVQGGELHAQLTGQAEYPIYASARDEFFYTVVDARISFERDPQDKVIALVLHQNGRDLRAVRQDDDAVGG